MFSVIKNPLGNTNRIVNRYSLFPMKCINYSKLPKKGVYVYMGYLPKCSDVEINYHTIQITTAASGAGVFNGVNTQFGWSSHSKANTALGTVAGHDNQTPNNINLVHDSDYMDTVINDQDVMWSIKI